MSMLLYEIMAERIRMEVDTSKQYTVVFNVSITL